LTPAVFKRQAPKAPIIASYRDGLVVLQFIEVLVSDVHTGETLKHFTWLRRCRLADRGGPGKTPAAAGAAHRPAHPSVWS
jgi:hypothetical protein